MNVQRPQLNGDAIRQELVKQYNRATTTSTDDVDLLAIDLFATMVQQYEAFITFDATKIIAEKFKSNIADEVLLALNVLEECMSKCGPKFHNEVGKFRFLNELIRLVSPQYEGDKTPKKIRDKILDLLLLWTINYPNEKKIKEAYDMLLKRGVKHETAKPVVVQNAIKTEPTDSKLREIAQPDLSDKLQRLLRSSNPADYKAANLLIQNMVKEKERRHEMKMRRKLELKEITENATLLKKMLDQNQDDKNGSELISEDELATLKCLYESCQKLQPTILILIGDTEDNECLDDALEANDLVTDVFRKYQQLVFKTRQRNAFLIMPQATNSVSNAGQNGSSRNTMDELNEIFASSSNANHSNAQPSISVCPLKPLPANCDSNINVPSDKSWQAIKDLNNATCSLDRLIEPMSPISTVPSTNVSKTSDTLQSILNNGSVSTLENASQDLKSVDASASQEKINASQSKLKNFDSELTQLVSGLKSHLKRETEEVCNLDDDNLLLDDEEPLGASPSKSSEELAIEETSDLPAIADDNANAVYLNKPLADIIIDLNDIRPHDDHQPRCIFEEKSGLKITLNFTRDKPRSDFAVLVITTTNHNSLAVNNFQFEASVPKPCKLHLQKPSGHELPGIKPFRPPTEDITQILLISNAEKRPLKLVCIISYILGDDPDMVKEFFEINDLPDLFN